MPALVRPNCICGATDFKTVFIYKAPPDGEIAFSFSAGGEYYREVLKCQKCSHFISVHSMGQDADEMYEGEYVSATYSDISGLKKNFERVVNLPKEKSDNEGRAQRVSAFARSFWKVQELSDLNPPLLDVGSGLGVFVYRAQQLGWHCTALDPDARAVEHIAENIGVEAIAGDYFKVEDLGTFAVVALNKVLEHVPDPVLMLAKTKENLAPNGFVYIEVPDGEMAANAGQGREEFFIDHLHIFSLNSLKATIEKAGYKVLEVERLQEPSTKFTLFAFVVPA